MWIERLALTAVSLVFAVPVVAYIFLHWENKRLDKQNIDEWGNVTPQNYHARRPYDRGVVDYRRF